MNTVIFDMDGVLVDSEYTFLESKTELLQEAGCDVTVEYQYQFMGTTFDFMWNKMKQELNLPLPIEDYIQQMNLKREKMIERDGTKPIKHVQPFVKSLYEANIQLAVASSSPKEEIIRALTCIGLIDYFKVLVSGEEVAHSKPKPDVFLRAAELLNVAPKDCIVFEDTKNGSLAAKAAGMYCIGFENPDYPKQDLSKADEIITSFKSISIDKIQKL